LRVYLEDLEEDPAKMHDDAQDALSNVIAAAEAIAHIGEFTGRDAPDVKT
jgi:phosphoglucomutase